MTPAAARLLRFAAFELDLQQEELRRGGVLLKLSPQQFRLLRFLAENAGEVCTRERIQQEIWGSETFVDFDRGLNVCIAQVRAILRDDSESPRFIQTVPRRGYRFVAPVECVTDAPVPAAPPPAKRTPRRVPLAILAAAVAAALFLVWRYAAVPERRTLLAILPLENTTHNAADDATLDGLLDELISQFGTLAPSRMGAVGRTSVMRYQGQHTALPKIAGDLGVNYMMEGDLRREDSRQRISLRLIRVADQSQVWNDTYQFEGAGALEFEEDVAARAGAAVVRTLFPRTPDGAPRHHPTPAAYEAAANGRYLQHQHTIAGLQRSLTFFVKAGQLDPAYAEPWAAAAGEYISLALSGASPAPDALAQAHDAAARALALDDASAEAHNAMGSVAFWRDWDFAAARRQFERALQLNPSLAQAHHDYALLQVVTGHAESGVASLKRALVLDPLSPRVNVDAGWVLLQAHRFEEAIRQARRALELDPGMREAQACIARAELYRGKRTAEDLAFFQTELGSANPYRKALAAAELGQKSVALEALRLAYRQHNLLMPLSATEPAFDTLREDASFPKLQK